MRTARRWPTSAALVAVVLGAALLAVAPRPALGFDATHVTLAVQKGGDRITSQGVNGLAGATFDFFAGTSGSPPGASDTPTASCVTAASGLCSVDVPGRNTGNQGYWIRERSTAAGFSIAQTMDVGGSPPTNTIYNLLFTGHVANNTLRTFPEASTGLNNLEARGSFWADIRNNPPLRDVCGLNIAILVDTSGSIAPFLPMVKAAGDGFVDALTGTPSRIALFRFANDASTLLPSTSVSNTAGADAVKAAIDGLSANGATNWDAGLFQIAAATSPFDAVLMLTDGDPTVYGPPPAAGPGVRTRFREVENGIFSANAVKAEGTRIVAVGVGTGVTGAGENLQSISGPVLGSDYVQTNYAQLAAVFRAIALATCAGTISVVKDVIPPGGTTADGVPTGGWTFTSSTTGVTPASGVTAAATGAVSFTAPLSGVTSEPVTLTETQQTGFSLVQVGGDNAVCTSGGNPVTVTNSGTLGFTVDALANDVVTCTVFNQAATPPAQVLVNKVWDINGTTFDDPSQPPDFQAHLTLTGQTNPPFGATFGGYLEGDQVTVGETVDTDLLPPGCTNVPSGDIGAHTLAAGLNTYQITNTVTCVTTLTLFKNVTNQFGTPAPVTDWTLSAIDIGTSAPILSGVSGVTGDVAADTLYPLAETSFPGYKQEVVTGAVLAPQSTGSWHCVLRLPDGSTGPEFDGLNGSVTVTLGQNAECTANNIAQPARLTLTKTVINTHGGTAVPSDWILTASPPTQSPAKVITGRDGEAAVTGQPAAPGTPYTLTESGGPSNYVPAGVPACLLTGTTTTVPAPGGVLTPDLGQDITCTFINQDTGTPPPPPPSSSPPAPPPLPVTGSEFAPVAGTGGLLFLAGLGLLVYARRRRSAEE